MCTGIVVTWLIRILVEPYIIFYSRFLYFRKCKNKFWQAYCMYILLRNTGTKQTHGYSVDRLYEVMT